jgi:hypothetical protein
MRPPTGRTPALPFTKFLQHFTGTTTNSQVAVFDVTDSIGILGSTCIKNTGANSMQYFFFLTDFFGNTTTVNDVLAAGAVFSLDHSPTPAGTAGAPYTEIKLTTVVVSSGIFTTFEVYKLQM